MEQVYNVYNLALIKEREIPYASLEGLRMTSPEAVVEIVDEVFQLGSRPEEAMILLCLDTKNKINSVFLVSQGTLNASMVHPREVFKRALLANANSIMLVHNHPSGDTTPSSQDIAVTNRLKKAGEIIGIELLDHIIVGGTDYLSMNARKLL